MDPIKAALIGLLALAAAQDWVPLVVAAQPGGDLMPTDRKAPEENTSKPRPPDEDLVITPAGPVRKKNVHKVGPDQAVRRNKDGTYTIVPKTDSQ